MGSVARHIHFKGQRQSAEQWKHKKIEEKEVGREEEELLHATKTHLMSPLSWLSCSGNKCNCLTKPNA